jgi:uncharacterized protein (TIGR03067 family)
MAFRLAIICGLVLAGAVMSRAEPPQKLDGVWEILTVAVAGEDYSHKVGEGDRIVFQGNKGTIHETTRERKFNIVVDSSREPPTIDLSAAEGGRKETCLGIYRIDGDRLHFTYAIPGEPRPKDFVSRKSDKSFVFVLKRSRVNEKTGREKLQAVEEAGHTLWKQKRFAEAARSLEEAVPLAREVFGDRSVRTARVLHGLASVYHAQGFAAQAEPAWEEALAILDAQKDTPASVLEDITNNLALVCQTLGHLQRAEELFQRSLKISEKRHQADDPETAKTLNNLGMFYLAVGAPEKAEDYLHKAVDVFARKYGKDDPRTVVFESNLAVLYRTTGQYHKAEPLLKNALEIWEEYDKNHVNVARILNNQGTLYQAMGQRKKSAGLLQRALTILRAQKDVNPAELATCLNNLAMIQIEEQDENAEKNLLESINIYEKAFGPDNAFVARPLHNLSASCLRRAQLDRALEYAGRSEKLLENQFGKDHPEVAYVRNNVGLLLLATNKPAEAERKFKDGLKICEVKFGVRHPLAAQCLDNLALAYARQERWDEALQTADRARRILRRHVQDVLPVLTEPEQLAFLKGRVELEFHKALSLALARPDDAAVSARTAEWVLNGKALAQEALARGVLLGRDSKDPALAKAFEELLGARADLAALTTTCPSAGKEAAFQQRFHTLTEREGELAKQIAGAGSREARPEPWIDLAEVRAKLPLDAVLIDIFRFDVFSWKGPGTGQPSRYAAWVLPPAGKGEVRFIDLGEAEPIDKAVREARRAIQDRVEPRLKPLAERILKPLAAATADYQCWILSPDSLLWLVPWAALPLSDGECVLEKHTICHVVSGRDLVAPVVPAASTAPLVMANPSFDLDPKEAAALTQRLLGNATTPTPTRGPRLEFPGGRVNRVFQPLAGTAREARAITPALARYAGVDPVVHVQEEALEGVFKKANNPRIVVLSTHAYFGQDQGMSALLASRGSELVSEPWLPSPEPGVEAGPLENPLLRCGLALAGANRAVQAAELGGDDGVLTGLEIVGANLRGAELVVLSACETGVGEVRNGEGVAGLQQAFQLAGARRVLATLWSVPDHESADLITAFFNNLATGQNKAEALRNAQLGILKGAGGTRFRSHPSTWAAWILSGDPGDLGTGPRNPVIPAREEAGESKGHTVWVYAAVGSLTLSMILFAVWSIWRRGAGTAG